MTGHPTDTAQVFRSSLMPVRGEWIDYNGHLNMAYYSVLMDLCADEIYPQIGFGPEYRDETGCTTYVAEFHICYVRELHENDQVFSTFRVMDFDAKRFHCFQELHHADGWLAATGEALTLHVDQSGPRVAPMPQYIQDNLARLRDQQSDLPKPARAGRRIGLTQNT